jgi:phosphate transport system permease protein
MAATDHLPARPDGLPSDDDLRVRREIRDIPTRVDRLFDRVTFSSGLVVLGLLLLVGYFLILRSRLAFQSQGFGFFTRAVWNTANGKPALGVLGLLVGTIVVAGIAILVAVPLAICAALFITEYAPPRWQRTLTSFIDLFAAIPSLIYGMWGVIVLAPRVGSLSGWATKHFGWVPFLSVHSGADLLRSFFIAGLVVALMCLPIIASVVREVFAQCPAGEKEAALALGGTRWGMVRSVVLPYGKGGIVGGSMLGLGRALGETIAVALILPQTAGLWGHFLESGGGTVAGFIAQRAGGDPLTVSGLLAAGLVLFAGTLGTNMLASVVIARSRSGAGVDI